MAFDLALLDEFSGDFARALFAEHPDWIIFARIKIAEDGETPDLVVEVPSPQPGDSAPKLVVYTEDSEVTVSFESYHNHFNWPVHDNKRTTNPLTLIAEILNENVAMVSNWRHDEWAGSWVVGRGEAVVAPTKFDAANRIRVRSWKGTFDQDLHLSEDPDRSRQS